MQFTLKNLLVLFMLFGLVFALAVSTVNSRRHEAEADRLHRLSQGNAVRLDVAVSVKTAGGGTGRFTETLEFPGYDFERGFINSEQLHLNGVAKPGLTFSGWLVGDFNLTDGFGSDSVERSGHVFALQISKFHESTFKTLEKTTKFFEYNGVERVVYDQDGITVTLKPSVD